MLLEIPVDRNLGAVAGTSNRLDLYENRKGSLVDSWRTTMPVRSPSVDTAKSRADIAGLLGWWLLQHLRAAMGQWYFLEPGSRADDLGRHRIHRWHVHQFIHADAHYSIKHLWSDANQNQWSQWDSLKNISPRPPRPPRSRGMPPAGSTFSPEARTSPCGIWPGTAHSGRREFAGGVFTSARPRCRAEPIGWTSSGAAPTAPCG